MIKRLLIANRGEIACRIMKTCQILGVQTVAVFSEADRRALHARSADQSVLIGDASPATSYLNADRIIQAALDTQADAIHPGYGFLSENAEFARAASKAGLIFVGPDIATIEAMGSKAAAKGIMAKAGVPLIPGYHGDNQSDEHLLQAAKDIGFPLMLKAAAGGGGKGMRIVREAKQFLEQLHAAKREAMGAFGDDLIILERYIERPRHIEAQIFGDRHGNIVHLFERDCSSQRRHQKIIEEAPAPDLADSVRSALLDSAVRAASAVNYVNAGTVEFLVDTASDEFFFLEMNTRLQVEHPVTEAITGIDMVEWQIRVASGEPLPLVQADIRSQGHAMEARIYAEDPDRGFLPSAGKITKLIMPPEQQSDDAQGVGSVRIDSGVVEGDEITIHYDPMIAKLIVHADSREQCRLGLMEALSNAAIGGLAHNLGFLQDLSRSETLANALIDTGLLDRDLGAIINTRPPHPGIWQAAAKALLANQEAGTLDSQDPWSLIDGWRLGSPSPRHLTLRWQGETLDIQAIGNQITGYQFLPSLDESGDAICPAIKTHCLDTHRVEVIGDNTRWRIQADNQLFSKTNHGPDGGLLVTPMPGLIMDVQCSEGDQVTEGQALVVMEAMKMELTLRAPFDGVISEVCVAAGQRVNGDDEAVKITRDSNE